jgi:hypothetical protein
MEEKNELKLKKLKNYYNINHLGKGRFQVFKEDNKFYHKVYKKGYLEEVFPKDKRGNVQKTKKKYRNWKNKSDKDLRKYHKTNYYNLSKSELSVKDQIFTQKLKEKGLFEKIVPKKSEIKKRKKLESLVN